MTVTASGSGSPPPQARCPVLAALSAAVEAVPELPVASGLGCEDLLTEQVAVLARACVVLERQLTVRMAALERAAPPAADVRGTLTRSGVDSRRARLLRQLGRFTDTHPTLGHAWHAGSVSLEQVDLVRQATARLTPITTATVIDAVLPALPDLDRRATRLLLAETVDKVNPGDPDDEEITDHAARRLSWATIPGNGGIVLDGYLPGLEAGAFTAAINALTEAARTQADQRTPTQRRADALAELVTRATAHGLPTGGGLPTAVTLTVSLTEAERIAAHDPAHPTTPHRRPRGRSTLGSQPAGDATTRFGLCCAAITPILHAPTSGPRTPGTATHQATGTADPHRPPPSPDTSPDADPRPDPSPDADPSQTPGQPRSDPDTRPGTPPPGTPPPAPGSLLDRITHTPTEPLAVGRAVRLATTAQRRALQHRDNGCVIPDCDIPAAYTQPHHLHGWALGGHTDLDTLVSLCWAHHHSTELGYYQITPRHPTDQTPPGALAHPHWWITPRNPRRWGN
jgi:Domain of unknown function (DUF222)